MKLCSPLAVWTRICKNLPQIEAEDGAVQEWTTELYDGAIQATKTGNLAAATSLMNAADRMVMQDALLHNSEYTIEEEQLNKK